MLWKIKRIPLHLSPQMTRRIRLLHRAAHQRLTLGLRHSTTTSARSWGMGRSHAATAKSRRPRWPSGGGPAARS